MYMYQKIISILLEMIFYVLTQWFIPPLLLQIMLHWNTLNKYNFYVIKNVHHPWNNHSLKYSHMYSLNILSPWNNTLLIHPPLLPWNKYPLKYPKCIYIYPPWNNLPLKQSPMYFTTYSSSNYTSNENEIF